MSKTLPSFCLRLVHNVHQIAIARQGGQSLARPQISPHVALHCIADEEPRRRKPWAHILEPLIFLQTFSHMWHCSHYRMAGLQHQPNIKLTAKLKSKPSKQDLLTASAILLHCLVLLPCFQCHQIPTVASKGATMRKPELPAWFPRCSLYKMAGCNPSTQHKIGDGIEFQGFQAILAVSICHPFAFF